MSRDDERDYCAEVEYEIWRRGGNPDAVDRDRCGYARDCGIEPEDHAARLIRERDDRRAERDYEDLARREYEEHCRAEDEYYRRLEKESNQ